MRVGRLLSFWDGIFSGPMLNFQGVHQSQKLDLKEGAAHTMPRMDRHSVQIGFLGKTPGKDPRNTLANKVLLVELD